MSDQNQKRDGGKPRMDLLPWNEFPISQGEQRFDVSSIDAALKIWWSARPFKLELAIPQRQIPGIAAVLAFGAAKYRPRGWEDGIEFSRVFAAACRHADSYARGELLDAETGLPHESHFWCNVLFLVVFAARGRTDLDDRPAPVASVAARLTSLSGITGDIDPGQAN